MFIPRFLAETWLEIAEIAKLRLFTYCLIKIRKLIPFGKKIMLLITIKISPFHERTKGDHKKNLRQLVTKLRLDGIKNTPKRFHYHVKPTFSIPTFPSLSLFLILHWNVHDKVVFEKCCSYKNKTTRLHINKIHNSTYTLQNKKSRLSQKQTLYFNNKPCNLCPTHESIPARSCSLQIFIQSFICIFINNSVSKSVYIASTRVIYQTPYIM